MAIDMTRRGSHNQSRPALTRRVGRALLCGAAILLSIATAGTVVPVRAQEPLAQFSSNVQLVEVYATVLDASGEPVLELRESDFRVEENGQEQNITAFAAGEFPLTVALGLDRSWSMAGEPLRLAKQASQTFLRELKPGDRSVVVAISNEADIIAPLSSDRAAQSQAIAAVDPWSTTALHDAIIAALDRLEREHGRQ